VAVIWQ